MNRPRRAPRIPTGPSITIAQCAQMLRNIRADPGKRISRDQGTQAVRDFYTRGELHVEYKQVSLVCPNSMKRIVDPVRGVNCTHLECFDLGAYLQSQVKNPTWMCPLCKMRTDADDLRMDEYTSYVLQMELDSVRFVEVFGNGSYRRIDLANVVDPPVVLTIDDEMPDAALEQNVDASEERMVVVSLKSLHDLDRQMKELRRHLPVKKDSKRKSMTVDPADVSEALHDNIRSIIKQATSPNLARYDVANCATQTSPNASVEQVQSAQEKAEQRTRLADELKDRKRKLEQSRFQLDATTQPTHRNVSRGHADVDGTMLLTTVQRPTATLTMDQLNSLPTNFNKVIYITGIDSSVSSHHLHSAFPDIYRLEKVKASHVSELPDSSGAHFAWLEFVQISDAVRFMVGMKTGQRRPKRRLVAAGYTLELWYAKPEWEVDSVRLGPNMHR